MSIKGVAGPESKKRRASAPVNPIPSSFENYQEVMADMGSDERYTYEEWRELLEPILLRSSKAGERDEITMSENGGAMVSLGTSTLLIPSKKELIDGYMWYARNALNETGEFTYFSKKEAQELLALPEKEQRAAAYQKYKDVMRSIEGKISGRSNGVPNNLLVTVSRGQASQTAPGA